LKVLHSLLTKINNIRSFDDVVLGQNTYIMLQRKKSF